MQLNPTPICNKAYGCINVKVGSEMNASKMIRSIFPEVEVHAVMKIKHRRSNGVRFYSYEVMVPGYILFYAPMDMQVSKFLALTPVNSILKYDDLDWHLRGDDLLFTEWVFQNKGIIGISVALMENDEIKIIDGPLKQMEGKIVRINKRSRSAQVMLGFKQHEYYVWLPFEWMEKAAERDCEACPQIDITIGTRNYFDMGIYTYPKPC